MTQERIDRLNQLARAKKQRELTAQELAEQAELRAEYLQSIRQSLTSQLDNTTIVYPDGTRKKLERRQ